MCVGGILEEIENVGKCWLKRALAIGILMLSEWGVVAGRDYCV